MDSVKQPTGWGVTDAGDLELVEVAVVPAEGGLEDLMEPEQGRRLWHEQPTPHRWLRANDWPSVGKPAPTAASSYTLRTCSVRCALAIWS
jgi:hypothetical protein